MAILAINSGSSSLKFSLHPLQGGQVQPHVLSGCIQGLEPGGTPSLDWKYQGQKQQEALAVPAAAAPFAIALERLRAVPGPVLVCGSLYLLGEFYTQHPWLLEREQSPGAPGGPRP